MTTRFTFWVFAILLLTSFASGQTKLPASPIKTVYITPTSHYDFGFVEPPDAIRERAARHIDEVIRVAESDPNFRWTIESVWQVNEWLKRAKKPSSVLPKDKEKIARLMNLIRSGRVALSMAWGSMHTDFMGEEELNRLCYDYTRLEKTYGVESQLAMMDDVPGHPTSVPSVLTGSGAKYLVTGANIFIGVSTSLAPGKVPFYWESPDGGKVLTWVSQSTRGGYTEALTDFYLDPYSLDPYTDRTPFEMFNPKAGKKTPLEVMEVGVTELLNRYNKAGYKYDAVMAMYAHDFIEPADVLNLEKAVKMWNARHREVQLKIATPPEFLKYIETKYASQIPTYRGEWSGLWSEAKTQSPKISALARYAHDHVPAAESLWSAIAITKKLPFPVGNASQLYDLMFTYDEHSGAGNTGWPQLNSSEPLAEQNRQYVGYMSRAKREVDEMLGQGLGVIAQPSRYGQVPAASAEKRSLVVYNGLSFARTDVVRVAPPAEGVRVEKVRDAAEGRDVKFDIDEQGQAVFLAAVPPFGYRTFEITTATGPSVSTLKENSGTEVREGNFRVQMRPDGNIASIRDTKTDREIISERGEVPFNSLLRVEGSEASRVVYPLAPRVTVRRGEVMSTITVDRGRSTFPTTVVTVYDGIDRVDIRNELDAAEMPFPGGSGNWNDSYYFAFPMNLPAEGLKIARGGQKWFDTLPDDYLPGARHDSVTTQHLIGLTSGGNSALIAHRQAFHWVYPGFVDVKMRPAGAAKQLPAMFTGKFPLPEATLYSRAVRRGTQADTHDLGVVNVPTVEPGLDGRYIFEYAIAGGGKFDDVEARRLGWAFNVPLMADYVQVPPAEAVRGYFSVDQPNVEIVVVKPVSENVIRGEVSASPLDPPINKRFIIRMQEFSGKATTVRVSLPTSVRSAALMNLTEDEVLRPITQVSPLTVQMKPFETATVMVEVE